MCITYSTPLVETLTELLLKRELGPAEDSYPRTIIKRRKTVGVNKSVRFADSVSIITCTYENSWYNDDDYKYFDLNMQGFALCLSRASGDVDRALALNQDCLRGLEKCVSQELFDKLKEERLGAVRGVLIIQQLQRLLGIKDPSFIAVQAKLLSEKALKRALIYAAIDLTLPRIDPK